MMPRALCASALCAVLLSACGGADSGLPLLESAEVVLPGFDSALVALSDGEGEVRDASGTLLVEAGFTDWRAVGDFDGDGATEAIVVVWASGGGSGTFLELALLSLEPGGWLSDDVWRWRASIPLGDRVRMRALTVDRTLVEVHLTRHAPDDPMCCPTEDAVLRFRAEAGTVRELSPREG